MHLLFVRVAAFGVVIFVAVIGILTYASQHKERRRVHTEENAAD